MLGHDPKLTVTIKGRTGFLDRLLMKAEIDPDALTNEEYREAIEGVLKHKRRPRKPAVPKVTLDRGGWERKAITYARWLAERDGIALPNGPDVILPGWNSRHWPRDANVSIEWCTVYVPTKTGEQRAEYRICSVSWGRVCGVFNMSKQFEADIRVELPHWDWVEPEVIDLSHSTTLAA